MMEGVHERVIVKKLLIVLVLAAIGFAVFKMVSEGNGKTTA
jgi:hypothetical protein